MPDGHERPSHPNRDSDLDAVQGHGRRWGAAAWAGATIVVAGPAVLTVYFFWRSSTDNGASCTFDNFDCAANRHFADAIGWLVVTVMAAVAVTLTAVLSRQRTR
jgi:hypothetical protein